MAEEFVCTPMASEFVKSETKGGPGVYDKDDSTAFGAYPRTHSSNGVPEKFYEKEIEAPSGESDQF